MPFAVRAWQKRVKNLLLLIQLFPFLCRYDGGGNDAAAAGVATPTISVAASADTVAAAAEGAVSVLGSPIRFEPPELDFQQQ